MKKIVVFMMLAMFSQEALAKKNWELEGLREHQELILSISDVKISHCRDCQVPLTRYSYKVEVKDAFLKLELDNSTSQGPVYRPYLESYTQLEKGISEGKQLIHVPMEGLYVGTVWKKCAPWAMRADGFCRDWEVHYKLALKIVEM